jgi:outer membrane PBP1 activator LpoA protein
MSFFARLLALGLISIALSACQGNQSKPDTDNSLSATDDATQSIESLLARAERADGLTRIDLQLQAAQGLVQIGDWDRVRSIINNMSAQANINQLPIELQARQALVKSRLAAADGYYPLAYEYVNSPQVLNARSTLSLDLFGAIAEQRASLLYDMGFYAASVEERVLLQERLSSDSPASRDNEQRLWRALMAIPVSELEQLVSISTKRELEGWYRLAALSKDTQSNLREQLARLDRWILEWPDHPASLELPADLKMLKQLLEEQPRQIAVLLPLSGPLSGAAKAISDGFMAAYYEQQNQTGDSPALRFYDTAQQDINALYDQAVAEGAQLVVGPLAKENLQELALRPGLPVPTLALNTIDNPLGVVPNLYQFGLGIEDEAQQAAEQAWRDGHRRAMVLAPDNNWGDRSVEAFVLRWRALGGEVTKDYRFTERNDYSKIIKQAMQLDQSEKRAQEVRAVVGSIEFEPRRRQDVDMIFLAAQASQARQIKPTLAFHYAADIPVYATSHVYSGKADAKLDQDMNDIKFSTLPWFFERHAAEKKALQAYADGSLTLQPLYAMGIDSFHLYPRLKQLEAVRQANFYGHTGTLQLNEQNQFQRRQVWAEFKSGRPQLLAESI